MSKDSWRDRAISTIAPLLRQYEQDCAKKDREKSFWSARKYLAANYPFGTRKYTPYRIWLEEEKFAAIYIVQQPAIEYLTWRSLRHHHRKQVKTPGQTSLNFL